MKRRETDKPNGRPCRPADDRLPEHLAQRAPHGPLRCGHRHRGILQCVHAGLDPGHDRRHRGGRAHLRDRPRQRGVLPLRGRQGILSRPVSGGRRPGRGGTRLAHRGDPGRSRGPAPHHGLRDPLRQHGEARPPLGHRSRSGAGSQPLQPHRPERRDGRGPLPGKRGERVRHRLRAGPEDRSRDRKQNAAQDGFRAVLRQVLEPHGGRAYSSSTTAGSTRMSSSCPSTS